MHVGRYEPGGRWWQPITRSMTMHAVTCRSSFSALTLLVGSFDLYKPVPDITYNVFGRTLSLNQSINHCHLQTNCLESVISFSPYTQLLVGYL